MLSKAGQSVVKILFEKQRLLLHLNFQLYDLKRGKLKLKLPYSQLARQQDQVFQRGIISTLGDVAAGLAACSILKHQSHSAITVQFKINFLQEAKGQYLMAHGNVMKQTKSLIFTQAQIYDDKQNMIAYLSQTIKRITPEDNPSIKVV